MVVWLAGMGHNKLLRLLGLLTSYEAERALLGSNRHGLLGVELLSHRLAIHYKQTSSDICTLYKLYRLDCVFLIEGCAGLE